MSNYTLIHVHSDDSLLDSATKFKDYVDLAIQNGQTAIATTEHGMHRGYVSKKLYCDDVGVKLLLGVEIYLTERLFWPDDSGAETKKVRDNYHTVLIAKNPDGIKELNLLVSKSSSEDHFYYTNRISFDEFLSISDNIISTSACLASPLNKLPEDHPYYEKLARKYTYLEVQPHIHPEQADFNRRLKRLADKLGKPLIVGTDTHSSTQYKQECRAVLAASHGKSYDDDGFDLSYKTYDEVVEMFREQGALDEAEYLAALENTNALADSVEDWSLDTEIKYPILYGSREEDSRRFIETIDRKFEEKLRAGIIPAEQEQAFRSAIKEELRVFQKLKMDGFMLSMSELISWCKENDIAIGTARGSVGGSRIAYVTDIIDLNPETWHTVFSRFANEDRVEIGDIDIDLIDTDRPAVFRHITERFGIRKTARVASYGTAQDKKVIEDVGRYLAKKWKEEHPFDEDNPYSVKAVAEIKEKYSENADRAKQNYPEIFYYLDGLVGVKVSQSVHPAGMIISPITLDDNYGTFTKDGEQCLLLDMEDAHETGLAKYDFLILKTIQVIRDACRYIGEEYPRTHEVDFNDAAVWEDMRKDLSSIFQFESPFSGDCFKKFKTNSIFDMSIVTACIRPSGSSYRDELLARIPHKNPSAIIDELLKDNLGRLIYQEDTIRFLQEVCGLSGSEADNIRRGIGRKDRARLEKAMPSILEGYCSKSDKPREIAEEEAKEFLQIIEDSASYQFGYNHSIAYCLLGFYCGKYRYYHPLEYITSYLNNAANDDDIKIGSAMAKRRGISITSPKFGVSRSGYYFNRESNTIAKGLSSIKFMGEQVADELYNLAQRATYTTFTDLLYDIAHETTVDSRQLEILIKIDFFSDFGNQRELIAINDVFTLFKGGDAKKLRRENVEGTMFEEIVRSYSTDKTKAGKEAKSFTLLDPMSIIRGCEAKIKSLGMEDLPLPIKCKNFAEYMGYAGFCTGEEGDRNKLFIRNVYPLKRKADGKLFGYNVLTQSLGGQGIESAFTVFKTRYEKDPIKQGDIVKCTKWQRDGKYFRMLEYEHIYA